MKKGQVTIFIILAIIVVVGVIGSMMFLGDREADTATSINPKQVVQKCVGDAVEKSVEKMLYNGGQRIPSHAIMYQGDEYNYLCYQADWYLSGYNLHPMLEHSIEDEIREDTKVEVQSCFDRMKEDFEDRGFDISEGKLNYSIDLLPGQIKINLNKRMNFVKGGSSQSFESFDAKILSPIYELVRIVREIVNGEAQYCYFEYNGYMLLYPEYNIKRIDYSDSKIYTVTDRRTGEEFRFAVRSCAFAPGI